VRLKCDWVFYIVYISKCRYFTVYRTLLVSLSDPATCSISPLERTGRLRFVHIAVGLVSPQYEHHDLM
jgi:hypothetical protein